MDEKDLDDGSPIEETEEEQTSEKTEEESSEEDKKDEEEPDKKDSSAIAQKKHWREKAQNLKEELETLKAQKSEELQNKQNLTEDEAERKAQEYIDKRIEALLEKREKAVKKQEEEAISKFESELEEVLEDSDFTEKQILDLCEEEKVTPNIAVKILKRQSTGKPKPNIPSPKKANPEAKIKSEERKPTGDFWTVTDKIIQKIRAGEK